MTTLPHPLRVEVSREALHGLLPIEDGESLAGVICRNAAVHGFSNPMNIFGDRVPFRTLGSLVRADVTSLACEIVRRTLGIGSERFSGLVYGNPGGSTFHIGGHELHRELRVANRRFCPECLRGAGPYHRLAWDCRAISACPIHSALLHDRCPDCGRMLRWSRSDLRFCPYGNCMCDLRSALTIRVAPEDIVAELDLVRRLDTADAGQFPIEGLDLDDWIRLLTGLGTIKLGKSTKKGKRNSLDVAEGLRIVLAGYRSAWEWPGAFEGFLDALRSAHSPRGKRYGLGKEFGPLLFWLYRHEGRSFYRPIVEAIADFVRGRPDLLVRRDVLRRLAPDHGSLQAHVTQAEASDILGVKTERLQKLANRYDLYFRRPDGKGASALIHRDRLIALRDKIEGQLNLDRTYAALGISKRAFQPFRQAGLLPEIPTEDRILDDAVYSAGDVAAFLSDLESRVVPVKGRRRLVPVASLARQWKTIADICRAVLDGRIVPHGVDKSAAGLARLRFDPKGLVALFDKPDGTFDVQDVAKVLGVNGQAVDMWAKSGLIDTVIGRSPFERGRRITNAALDRFRALYVSGPEFMKSIGGPTGQSGTVHLLAAGVVPVSGPTVDGNRQYLFRRSEIGAAEIQRIRWAMRPVNRNDEQKAVFAYGRTAAEHAGRVLGWRTTSVWNRYDGAEEGQTFCVIVGRRAGVLSGFTFSVTARLRRALAGVKRGYVVLAFYKMPFFMIVPWAELARRFPKIDRDRTTKFVVPLDRTGKSRIFEEYLYPVNGESAAFN